MLRVVQSKTDHLKKWTTSNYLKIYNKYGGPPIKRTTLGPPQKNIIPAGDNLPFSRLSPRHAIPQ